MKRILEFKGNYFFLSNYYERPMEYRGYRCTSSESAYQAMKAKEEKMKEHICGLSADDARHLAHKLEKEDKNFRIDNWDNLKYGIMLDIVREKFNQHKDLATKLVATGNSYLEEGNNWGDIYYGVCNGVGQNNLGKILMQVRKELRESMENRKEAKYGYSSVKLPCDVPGIGYTVKHRRVVNLLMKKYAKQMLDNKQINKKDYNILINRGKCHDMDKILMSLSYPQLTADYFHRIFNGHHMECIMEEQSKYDYIEMIMDMESAHYTKPDKPGNAYIFCSQFRPWVFKEAKQYFDILGLDETIYTDKCILKQAQEPVYEAELINNIVDYIHTTGIHMMDNMARIDDEGIRKMGDITPLRHPKTAKNNTFKRPADVCNMSKSIMNLELIRGSIWAQLFDMDKICLLSVEDRKRVNNLCKTKLNNLMKNKLQR